MRVCKIPIRHLGVKVSNRCSSQLPFSVHSVNGKILRLPIILGSLMSIQMEIIKKCYYNFEEVGGLSYNIFYTLFDSTKWDCTYGDSYIVRGLIKVKWL
jgi:hypothetical protein